MKKWIMSVVAAALCCGNVFGNQIPNFGFDQESDGNLAGWIYGDKKGPQALVLGKENIHSSQIKITRIEEPAGSGQFFIRMESDGKQDKDYIEVSSNPFTVPAGFTYQITGDFRGKGLLRESGSTRNAAAGQIMISCRAEGKEIKTNTVQMFSNCVDWTECSLVDVSGSRQGQITIPAKTESVRARFGFSNSFPNNPVRVDFRNIALRPVDYSLPNPSFEQSEADGTPTSWQPYGSAKTKVVDSPVHGGSKAIEVTDAPIGQFTGWSTIVPVRPDREYRLKGYAKAGDLKPGTEIAGGALSIQFLDGKGQPLGEAYYSKATTTDGQWSELMTPKATPPNGAVTARLTAGMTYCAGSSWFDDLSIEMSPVVAANAAKVLRPNPQPSSGTSYAKNLLKNGDVEAGENGQPIGWTYVGKSEPDWTPEEIASIHGNNRPKFSDGRGKGQWSQEVTYQGKGSLCNISVDPPLSTKVMFYGRTPVDGYWFSDPMTCEPGQAYMAGCWIRPGVTIDHPWYGPLEIRFFDKNGKFLPQEEGLRTMLSAYEANQWSYWFTPPFVAPENAATMRLRFGQEMSGDKGGWGSTYADNIAVWAMPPEGNLPESRRILFATPAATDWFAKAHAKIKPPYMPSPTAALEYLSVWGKCENTVPGNMFEDPNSPVKIRFQLYNALGEERKVYIKGLRTDWTGTNADEFSSPAVTIPAYSQAPVEISLPPAKGYGSFHLSCNVIEGEAKVGDCDGRYAVIPPQQRKRTQENIWAVAPLFSIEADNSPAEQEVAEVFKRAGFGVTFVREYENHGFTKDPRGQSARREVQFYNSIGIRVVLQLEFPNLREYWKPTPLEQFDPKPYFEYGQKVAGEYKGKVVAYGNWGVEQSNNRTPQTPVYRPIKNGKFLSNEEYDLIYMAIHDGIRSVDKETPILIGNTATDRGLGAIKRMYGEPVKGRFDGVINNSYFARIEICQASLAEFDKHGDTNKSLWEEENSDQRSPNVGPGRRYGEWEGASNLVRSWVALACKMHPRIRAVTQWGFCPRNRLDWVSDRCMMDIRMQPRPHFVAHAVMSDELADAQYKQDHSTPDTSLFEYDRTDNALFVAWANAGEREATFESPADLTVKDIMGNARTIKSVNGVATIHLTAAPLYISGPKAFRLKAAESVSR